MSDVQNLSPDEISWLQEMLLGWFEANKRDLPWRNNPDPYAIWISEVMAQQTRVDVVRGYYVRWMLELPTVQRLAAAHPDHLMRLWQGLGYYSRARNLQAAARAVCSNFGGEMPRTMEGLLSLPGVGPYTAGAVASLAFGLQEPVVDGNVIRVLTRVFAIGEDAAAPRTSRLLWSIAGQLVKCPTPGRLNESMMELGALVCTPRSPSCEVCPLGERCQARERGLQNLLPIRSKKAASRREDCVAAVFRRKDTKEVLLVRRPARGLLADLWEFPIVDATLLDAWPAGLRMIDGLESDHVRSLGMFKHVFSHIDMYMEVIEVWVAGNDLALAEVLGKDSPKYVDSLWTDDSAIGVAISTLMQRELELATSGRA